MDELESLAVEAACGNRAAVDFLLIVTESMHLWDDLIDKDKSIADETVHRVFTNLLCTLPINPFYRQYHQVLSSAMLVAIQNWHVANAAERADDSQSLNACVPLDVAFVLRSSYVDWVTLTASLCGGVLHGRAMAVKVRELAHREGFDKYLRNLAHEKARREGVL